MASTGHSPAFTETPSPLTEEQRAAIRAELHRMLASPAFRASKRCQDFMRFVVERTLEGSTEHLKERSIGVEVFGRRVSYDTGDDAIVRVKANELRRRLAQYYSESPASHDVRIDLPSGSYAPEFHWGEPATAPLPAVAPAQAWNWRWLAFGGAAIALAGLAAWLRPDPSTPVQDFWAPAIARNKPVVICIGQTPVYLLSQRIHREYRKTLPVDPAPGPYVIKLPPGAQIDTADIVPAPDQFVGVGCALSTASLMRVFTSARKPTEIRIGSDFSSADLRTSPVVLIGAYSNAFTLEMTRDFRFVFDLQNNVKMVRETVAPHRKWELPGIAPDGKTRDDFAIVSRVVDSQSGEPFFTLAGITQYGTQSAGEFATTPEYMAEALKQAPPDWRKKNMQVLLSLKIVGKSPSRPHVVATHFW